MLSLFNLAHAETAGASVAGPSMIGQLVMLGGFVLIFWFLIWRPQSKRTKAHKNLLGTLAKGDEVMTTGGIAGTVIVVTDDFITLQVSDAVVLNFQKSAVASALPKGTIKAIK